MADTGTNSSSRIAFTLPLSCQICLGKVKLPVVCPNQHVFCSPCMDVWLQRNQQCPSCRVPITPDNPCKKILGGLSQNDVEEQSFAKSKELRRSRLELLCKDYEDEIERIQSENDSLKQENKLLEEQVTSYAAQKLKEAEDDVSKGKPSSSSSASPSQPDMNMLMMLTKKLQDATGLYERVKKDMDKLKQENVNCKDENAALTRENQRIRGELVGRSPRKFGRFTVATLETKLERYGKEMGQLQKALERSDAYIEEVEKELEAYRSKVKQPNTCIRCKCTLQVEKARGNDKCDFGDKVRDPLKEAAGESDGENVQLSKAESSLRNGRLRKESNGESDLKGTNENPQPSTSGDAWRKLPEELEDSKKSVSLISFYGKRPHVKESKPGQSKPKPSQAMENERTPGNSNDTSFELELPSPTSSSVVSSSGAGGSGGVFDKKYLEGHSEVVSTSVTPRPLSNDSTTDTIEPNDTIASASSMESCKKRLRFESDMSDVSGMSTFNSPDKGKGGKKGGGGNGKQVTFNQNVAVKNMIRKKNALSDSLLDVTLPSDTSEVDILNDIKSPRDRNLGADESYDANMSMNSDIMDCMELFSSAERRLDKKKHSDGDQDSKRSAPAETVTRGSDRAQEDLPPPQGRPDFLQTFPQPSQSIPRSLPQQHTMPAGLDFMGPTPSSFAAGGPSHFASSSSTMSNYMTSSKGSADSVSSTLDPYSKAYPSTASTSSRSYASDHISSSRGYGDHLSQDYTSRSTGLSSMSSYQPPNTRPEASSSYRSGSMSQGASGLRSSSSSSISDPPFLTQAYPPRPASTSTLQGMLHTVTSLEEESSRPLSAPGAAHQQNSGSWKTSSAPFPSGISSSSDFRPSSSVPGSSYSAFNGGHARSQASVTGLPGGGAFGGVPSGGLSSDAMSSVGLNSGGISSGGLHSGGMSSGGLHSGGMSSGGLHSGGMSSVGLNSGGMSSGGLHSGGMSSGGLHSGGMSSGGLHSGGMSSGGLHSGGMNSGGLHSGGMSSGFSGSQGSLPGLSTIPGLPVGFPPPFPGGNALSQPSSSRYGGDFGSAGLFGLGSSSSGFMSGFGGGLTQ